MTVFVDGFPREIVEGTALADLLQALGEAVGHALVEVNGSFVHPREYGERLLRPGDRVEVIYPAYGG